MTSKSKDVKPSILKGIVYIASKQSMNLIVKNNEFPLKLQIS